MFHRLQGVRDSTGGLVEIKCDDGQSHVGHRLMQCDDPRLDILQTAKAGGRVHQDRIGSPATRVFSEPNRGSDDGVGSSMRTVGHMQVPRHTHATNKWQVACPLTPGREHLSALLVGEPQSATGVRPHRHSTH